MESATLKTTPVKERKVKGKVVIDIQKCKGCELCTVACKEEALKLSETINIKGYRYIVANNDLCNGCINCALVCPDAVITVYRTSVKKKKTVVTPPDVREQLKEMMKQDTNHLAAEVTTN
ncbi:MAG: ferredoxin family protein [Chitinophagales bacterium]|nr:ferredoxin family protein [Chitinophagales bacterium]